MEEINGEVVESTGLVRQDFALKPVRTVMDLPTAMQRMAEFQAFVDEYLEEGEDFGRIPGTEKPTLFKPGADKLCELYGLADTYEEIRSVIDWHLGLFDYEIRCTLSHDGRLVTTGMGSCSSFETKYRFREQRRRCPRCGKEAIIKGKAEFEGGWVCWRKKQGCNAKFAENDPDITGQVVGQIEQKPQDLADVKNTVLKMAKKRAKIDAALSATRSSGIFSQDRIDEDDVERPPKKKKKTAAPAPAAAAAPAETGQPGPAFISHEDRKPIYAAASRVNLGQNEIKKYLAEVHQVDSTNSMTRAVADDVMQWLRELHAVVVAREQAHIPADDLRQWLAEVHHIETLDDLRHDTAADAMQWLQMQAGGEGPTTLFPQS